MTAQLPDPPLPPGTDLRHFDKMPVDVGRVRDSALAATGNPADNWFAFLLWCAAFHQVPAGSLPNDEIQLCYLAGLGRDLRTWKKHREGALRGFILCSDGRLWHPVVVEMVVDRLEISRAGKKGALARWGAKSNQPTEKPQDTNSGRNAEAEPTAYADPHAPAMPRGEGSRREGKGDSPPTPSHGRNGSDPGGTRPSLSPPNGSDPAVAEPEKPPDVEALFATWWTAAPRKIARGKAQRAYQAALKLTTPGVLLDGITRYATESAGHEPRYVKHPATWLNGQCWSDEPLPLTGTENVRPGARQSPAETFAAGFAKAAGRGG